MYPLLLSLVALAACAGLTAGVTCGEGTVYVEAQDACVATTSARARRTEPAIETNDGHLKISAAPNKRVLVERDGAEARYLDTLYDDAVDSTSNAIRLGFEIGKEISDTKSSTALGLALTKEQQARQVLERTVSTVQVDVSTVQGDVSILQEKVSSLNTDVRDAKSAVSALQQFQAAVAACTAKGLLTAEDGTCGSGKCTTLKLNTGVKSTGSLEDAPTGAIVEVYCESGSAPSVSVVSCTAGGQWSAAPKCLSCKELHGNSCGSCSASTCYEKRKYKSCAEVYEAGLRPAAGLFDLEVDGKPYQTKCKFDAGKGWTMIARVVNGLRCPFGQDCSRNNGQRWGQYDITEAGNSNTWETKSTFGSASNVGQDFKSLAYGQLVGDRLRVDYLGQVNFITATGCLKGSTLDSHFRKFSWECAGGWFGSACAHQCAIDTSTTYKCRKGDPSLNVDCAQSLVSFQGGERNSYDTSNNDRVYLSTNWRRNSHEVPGLGSYCKGGCSGLSGTGNLALRHDGVQLVTGTHHYELYV